MFERYSSDILVNERLRSMCIMVEREEEFLPVVSISDQGNDSHVWKEAYK